MKEWRLYRIDKTDGKVCVTWFTDPENPDADEPGWIDSTFEDEDDAIDQLKLEVRAYRAGNQAYLDSIQVQKGYTLLSVWRNDWNDGVGVDNGGEPEYDDE